MPGPVQDSSPNAVDSITELVERARDSILVLEPTISINGLLRVAEIDRQTGLDHLLAQDIVNAFMLLTRAATLMLVKIPAHASYARLPPGHLGNLQLEGNAIIERLISLKPLLRQLIDSRQTQGARSTAVPSNAVQRFQNHRPEIVDIETIIKARPTKEVVATNSVSFDTDPNPIKEDPSASLSPLIMPVGQSTHRGTGRENLDREIWKLDARRRDILEHRNTDLNHGFAHTSQTLMNSSAQSKLKHILADPLAHSRNNNGSNHSFVAKARGPHTLAPESDKNNMPWPQIIQPAHNSDRSNYLPRGLDQGVSEPTLLTPESPTHRELASFPSDLFAHSQANGVLANGESHSHADDASAARPSLNTHNWLLLTPRAHPHGTNITHAQLDHIAHSPDFTPKASARVLGSSPAPSDVDVELSPTQTPRNAPQELSSVEVPTPKPNTSNIPNLEDIDQVIDGADNVDDTSDIDKLVSHLGVLLMDQRRCRYIFKEDRTNAQILADVFQKVLITPGVEGLTVARLVPALLRLCKTSKLYPTCTELTDLSLTHTDPVAEGGFGAIWKGEIRGRVVSIKMAKMYETSDIEKLLQSFSRDATVWSALSHPNVLPFYGLYLISMKRQRVSLISPWMENGNLVQYLHRHPEKASYPLAIDMTLGLKYLHDNGIVHGDLKGANILVTDSGHACIADFGLASTLVDSKVQFWTHSTATTARAGSIRWQAPELIRHGKIATSTDVYALGCLFYELFCGRYPFHDISHDPQILLKVLTGERPHIPETVPPEMRQLVDQCWAADPTARPATSVILARLLEVHGVSEAECLDATWDSASHAEFRSLLHGNTNEQKIQEAMALILRIINTPIVSQPHTAGAELDDITLNDDPVAEGAFGSLWKGAVRGQAVAVKVSKANDHSEFDTVLLSFSKEAIAWCSLSHPNVLPFYGLYSVKIGTGRRKACLLSPWMQNGNLKEYLDLHPDTTRLPLAVHLGSGLKYIHDEGIVHGSLKGANILITPSHQACIADFGLTSILADSKLKWTQSTATTRNAGGVRWQAPEQIQHGLITIASDVYALGCVYYELFSGNVPYHQIREEIEVLLKVITGERPNFPDHIPLEVRALISDCWGQEASLRPVTSTIIERLTKGSGNYSDPEWDSASYEEFRHLLQQKGDVGGS